MLRDVEAFVNIESPSHEVDDLRRSAMFLADLMERVLGTKPTLVESSEGPHVHWKGSGDTRVLVVGHHDTACPNGSGATEGSSRDRFPQEHRVPVNDGGVACGARDL